MSDVKMCNSCGKLISERQEINMITIHADELTQDDKGNDYDFHGACWERIKGNFKVKQ